MMPGPLSCASTRGASCRGAAPVSALRTPAGLQNCRKSKATYMCRAESGNSTQEESSKTVDSQASLSDDETRKLAALSKQPERQREIASSTNIIQGAFEEAQLISWPKPQKAFFDTILVLAIVIGSGSLLLGVNVLLANISDWWYHQG